jgi:hypothetical protein
LTVDAEVNGRDVTAQIIQFFNYELKIQEASYNLKVGKLRKVGDPLGGTMVDLLPRKIDL